MDCDADGELETGRRRLLGRSTVTLNRCVWNRGPLGGRRGGDGQTQVAGRTGSQGVSSSWRSLLVAGRTGSQGSLSQLGT
ncbi:serine/threonine-protein kinase [Sesbania bispinosa]|nr:serine/threonine-protein kinase [Sesbania bispinosa]